VQVECRKCLHVFWTAAKTRTTCPGCKAAVTIRRERDAATYDVDGSEETQHNPWVTAIGGLAAAGLVIFSIFKDRGPNPPQ
jgi:hypothetical protein